MAREQGDGGDDRGGPRGDRAEGEPDPEQQHDGQDRGAEPDGGAEASGVLADRPGRLQGEEERAVGEREGHDDHAAEQAERVEQGEEVARELHLLVDRQAADDVGQGDADEQRGDERAADDGPVPPLPPGVGVALPAVLEAHVAHDECEEQDEQRQVEGGEHRGVPLGERREGGATGGEQPDLVAVPVRADGREHDPAALLGVGGVRARAEDRQQHADAEVEALEDEVAGPQDRDEDEPDEGEIHDVVLFLSRRTGEGRPRPCRRGRSGPRRARRHGGRR